MSHDFISTSVSSANAVMHETLLDIVLHGARARTRLWLSLNTMKDFFFAAGGSLGRAACR